MVGRAGERSISSTPSDFLAISDLLGIFGTNPARARTALSGLVAVGNVQVSDTWPWDDVT
jgi:hypothetical protein